MDMKQWLLRYKRAKFKAESLWRQAKEWKEKVSGVSSMLIDGMPHGSGKLDSFESGIIKSLDLEYEAQLQTKYAREVRAEIQEVLNQVEDFNEFKILTLKYLEDRSWTEIADDLGFSKTHVFRLHDDALQKLGSKCDQMLLDVTKCNSM